MFVLGGKILKAVSERLDTIQSYRKICFKLQNQLWCMCVYIHKYLTKIGKEIKYVWKSLKQGA